MNWTKFIPWIQGLIAAVITGAVGTLTANGLAPEAFNMGPQWKRTVVLAFVNGLAAAALYLKQSPFTVAPKEETNEKTN